MACHKNKYLVSAIHKNLTRHVVHDHVEVLGVLEGEVQLNDPLRVRVGHDVSLLPEEGAVAALDLEEHRVRH